MRRYCITRFQPVSRRSGVIARVRTRTPDRPVPVVSVRSSDRVHTQAAGQRPKQQPGERQQRGDEHRRLGEPFIGSVELLQVHTGIHRRDLVAVAVEHQGRTASARSSPIRRSRAWVHRG